ncbi:hypothetical protein T492DRAFT_527446 [Pavlovales sp. CCMP2436]|nr:hypothetical protein T492DRAFT_527446 [Pavlovales sp. CCMP2436]
MQAYLPLAQFCVATPLQEALALALVEADLPKFGCAGSGYAEDRGQLLDYYRHAFFGFLGFFFVCARLWVRTRTSSLLPRCPAARLLSQCTRACILPTPYEIKRLRRVLHASAKPPPLIYINEWGFWLAV